MSHRLQPLDISIFRLLKRNSMKHLERKLQNDLHRIQHVEWIEAFIAVHQDSFRVSSIESSFQSAGIYLFDPSEVLLKIDHTLLPSLLWYHPLGTALAISTPRCLAVPHLRGLTYVNWRIKSNQLVETAEKEAPKKKRSKGRRKRTPTPESSEEEDGTSEDELLGVWSHLLVIQLVLDFSVGKYENLIRFPYWSASPTMTLVREADQRLRLIDTSNHKLVSSLNL